MAKSASGTTRKGCAACALSSLAHTPLHNCKVFACQISATSAAHHTRIGTTGVIAVQSLAKSFEAADLPSRCAKFVPRKQWVAIGSDDMYIRIFNYNTMEREKTFEAHADYIRSLAVHPSLPYLLSCSDDMLIKLWDWDKGWACTQIFEGHVHYVMQARPLPVRLPLFVGAPRTCYVGIRSDSPLRMRGLHADFAHSGTKIVCSTSCQGANLTTAVHVSLGTTAQQRSCTSTELYNAAQVVFNPKDTSTFASASLDRTVKVWSISQPTPNFTLEGHEKGVNTVDYLIGGDRPYLVSGADDKLCKVWDYQTKACVQTLEGHTGNVSAVCFHPELPLIITASEDGSVKVWHSTTYRLEHTINYGMERVWAVGYVRGSNAVALGYDNGLVMLKLGNEEPVASMDASGKVIYARHNDVLTATVKALGADYDIVDGERLPLPVKVRCAASWLPTFLCLSACVWVCCADRDFAGSKHLLLPIRARRAAPRSGLVLSAAYRAQIWWACV